MGGSGTTATLWHCTAADNDYHGVFQEDGTLTLTNSIIAFNINDGIHRDGGTLTHTYNLVHGNISLDYIGTSADPSELSGNLIFVSSGDYHIESNSPAIDTGTDASGVTSIDFEGDSRPNGAGFDMGCDEVDGPLNHGVARGAVVSVDVHRAARFIPGACPKGRTQ